MPMIIKIPKRRKQAEPVRIGAVISDLLVQIEQAYGREALRIWRAWDRVMDTKTATNARPATFKDGCLIIHVSSSPWLHHLRIQQTAIQNLLNDALAADVIKQVRFKIGASA